MNQRNISLSFEKVDVRQLNIALDVFKLVSASQASHYRIIPFQFDNNILSLATAYPEELEAQGILSSIFPYHLEFFKADEKHIRDLIEEHYGLGAGTVEQMMKGRSQQKTSLDSMSLDEKSSEASMSQFLDQMLKEAIVLNVTDIHIETQASELDVRYRVDGFLQDVKTPANLFYLKDLLFARIKVLCHLNIAENRRPQDGKFSFESNGKTYDIRVSLIPTASGESAVMRVLKRSELIALNDLGVPDQEFSKIQDLLQQPNGIIFLTGPTGSGKTTTLYALLNELNQRNRKIITLEDPIEYQLDGITQIPIKPELGVTFAQGLRTVLRHDPDVLMVGEIRDSETAEIAMQSAMTGHLVLSTLHANDSVGGISRLKDIGVETFLINSSIRAIVSQRLIRQVCENCKSEQSWSDHLKKEFEKTPLSFDHGYEKGEGCDECRQTGYVGRRCISEILILTPEIQALIEKQAPDQDIQTQAQSQGMITLWQSGIEAVKQGWTTPEEVLRVVSSKESLT